MNFSLWNGSQTVWSCCRNTQVRGCCDDPCPLQQNNTNDGRVCHWVTVSPLHTPGLHEMPASPFASKDCKGKAYALYEGRTWRFFTLFGKPLKWVVTFFFFLKLVPFLFFLFYFCFLLLLIIFALIFLLIFIFVCRWCSPNSVSVASLLNSLLFLFLALLFFFSAYAPIVFFLTLVHKLLWGIVP